MVLLFLRFGYETTWQFWNIPTMTPHFADLRTITGLSFTLLQGLNPMLNNPGDPWQRPFNYPPIWKVLVWIGVRPQHTTLIGILFIGLFFIGLCLPFAELPWAETFFLMLGVLSPAVLLGIERANTDLLIFFLVSIAAWLLGRSTAWATLAFQMAIFLKLYPLFSLVALTRLSKRVCLSIAGLILAISTLYFLINFREILLAFQATPKSHNLSYGISVLPQRLERSPFAPFAKPALYLTSVTAIAITLGGIFFGKRCDLSQNSPKAYYLDAFRAGSAIYIGTFFLGSNFDYRLMFLLLTIPQLVFWWQDHNAWVRRIAKISAIALYLSLWHRLILRGVERLLPANFPPAYSRALAFFPDELANWVLFGSLVVLLAASLPRWFYSAST
jgi:hypothetical protein